MFISFDSSVVETLSDEISLSELFCSASLLHAVSISADIAAAHSIDIKCLNFIFNLHNMVLFYYFIIFLSKSQETVSIHNN